MRRIARGHGAATVAEHGVDLYSAVRQGLDIVSAREDAVLVLPSDLPRLATSALEKFLAVVPDTTPTVALVPCQRGEGTNALLLRPPDVIAPRFGPGSFSANRQAAEMAGVVPTVFRSDAFTDLDTPGELILLDAVPRWLARPDLPG